MSSFVEPHQHETAYQQSHSATHCSTLERKTTLADLDFLVCLHFSQKQFKQEVHSKDGYAGGQCRKPRLVVCSGPY